MSIAEMQACLARLYVDEAFLKLFKLKPGSVLEHYSLTEREREALLGIDKEGLTQFATSLKAKKKGRFSGLFPLSFRIMPKAMDRYTHRYYQVRGISQGDKQLELVLDFGRFVEETLAGDEEVPFYAPELVRYERLLAECKLSPRRPPAQDSDREARASGLAWRPAVAPYVRLGRFASDIEEVCRLLRRDEDASPVRRGEFHVAFCPAVAWGRARTFQLTGPTRHLISLCDGRRAVSELIEELLGEYGDVVNTSVPGILSKLFGMGLLEAGRTEEERHE